MLVENVELTKVFLILDIYFICLLCFQAIMGLAYNGLVQPTALHIPSVFANIVSEANVSDRFSMQLCSYHEKDDVDGVFAIGPMEPR